MALPNNPERTPLLSQPKRRDSDINSAACDFNISTSITQNDLSKVRRSSAVSRTLVDEEATIDESLEASTSSLTRTTSIGHVVSVLLIGSFISNADSSLLFATHPIIASEFNALQDSSWLLTSFALAQAATQPLYGKSKRHLRPQNHAASSVHSFCGRMWSGWTRNIHVDPHRWSCNFRSR